MIPKDQLEELKRMAEEDQMKYEPKRKRLKVDWDNEYPLLGDYIKFSNDEKYFEDLIFVGLDPTSKDYIVALDELGEGDRTPQPKFYKKGGIYHYDRYEPSEVPENKGVQWEYPVNEFQLQNAAIASNDFYKSIKQIRELQQKFEQHISECRRMNE